MSTARYVEQRPWGSFAVLLDEPTYKVKRIVVRAGQRLSLQYHHRRSEHWCFVAGSGVATLDRREIPVRPGDVLDVPAGAAHRVHNTGGDDLVFIEIQRGEYFGEDDIVRLADDYHRVP
jgi:mannose-6-phosphate isomerase-like protein (cupin superfamily)